MKLNIKEMRKDPFIKYRLAYNIMTGNRIDVEICLDPLKAVYKISNDEIDIVNIFTDLKSAIDKFNYLEGSELDAKDLDKMEAK